jgi:hypothetical protein
MSQYMAQDLQGTSALAVVDKTLLTRHLSATKAPPPG